MKKSDRFHKLNLRLETARPLTTNELVGVRGGAPGEQRSDSPSCTCVTCGGGSGSNGGSC